MKIIIVFLVSSQSYISGAGRWQQGKFLETEGSWMVLCVKTIFTCIIAFALYNSAADSAWRLHAAASYRQFDVVGSVMNLNPRPSLTSQNCLYLP